MTRKLWKRKLTFRLKLIVHNAENGPSGFKSSQVKSSQVELIIVFDFQQGGGRPPYLRP